MKVSGAGHPGGGRGHGVGGGVGGGGTTPAILPGDATIESLYCLNQHSPRESVKKRQPFTRHSADAQALQHSLNDVPGIDPKPGVLGSMSVLLSRWHWLPMHSPCWIAKTRKRESLMLAIFSSSTKASSLDHPVGTYLLGAYWSCTSRAAAVSRAVGDPTKCDISLKLLPVNCKRFTSRSYQ